MINSMVFSIFMRFPQHSRHHSSFFLTAGKVKVKDRGPDAKTALSNPQLIHLFKRTSTAPADYGSAVAADQGIVHFVLAHGAIKRLAFDFFCFVHEWTLKWSGRTGSLTSALGPLAGAKVELNQGS